MDTVSARGVPIDLADGIVNLLTRSLQSYPLNLQASGLKVTESGITIALTGSPTTSQTRRPRS
ncbi:hypothetical protein ABZ894_14740 [Nocardia beijingensis]|uniref:hypothetical protein n=1 Tax=Nocardia beijingensis TaxID=95162 RepID=UPI003402FCB0